MGHKLRSWARLAGCLLVGLLVAAVCAVQPVRSQTVYTVNSMLDEPDAFDDGVCSSTPSSRCTVRAAVTEGQRQNRAVSVPAGTYELTIDQLVVTQNLTITGAGSGQTRIDGSRANKRVFDIGAGGFAYIGNMTVQYGEGGQSVVVPSHFHGGGIHNHGTLVLVDSTVLFGASSPSWGGGGIMNAPGATATLVNVTLGSNTGATVGGGIENGGTMDIYNSTIANNQAIADGASGGGIYGSGTTRLRNTIVANNFAGQNCAGTVDSIGYNLSSDASCISFTGATNSLSNTDARLGGRDDDNMYPPFRDSPAIDAGNPAAPGSGGNSCGSKDQRGVSRPEDGDLDGAARCDIGAFEYDPPRARVAAAATSVDENGSSVTITVLLSRTYTQSVNVGYSTANGSAVAGSDYVPTAGTLSFGSFQTSRTITLPILDDSVDESDESFTLQLGGTSQAGLGTPAAVTVTIRDNDGPAASPSPEPSPPASPSPGATARRTFVPLVAR